MKKGFKKWATLGLVVVMASGLFLATGCGKSDDSESSEKTGWAAIEEAGTLNIGLDATFAPMGFMGNDGEVQGFDIDLSRAVCKLLGVEPEFKSISWDAKELELSSKSIDCIWNGMSASQERQEIFALTKKYLNNKIAVMSFDKKVVVESIEDLKNLQIGTQVDSSALEAMKASPEWDTFKDNVKEYPTYDEVMLDMKVGRTDIMVVDQVLGEYKNSLLDKDEKMVTFNFGFGDDFYAIGCRKEEPEVAEKINEALATLIENGEAAKISEKWFGKNIVILEDYE